MSLPPGERIEAELAEEGVAVPDIVIEPDADRLARAAASAFVARVAAAQAVHGTASVVLTGGGVGTAMLQHVGDLAEEPEREVVDWTAVEVWWGDERFVPAGSDDRNELGARRALLDRVGIPEARVHPMPAADGEFATPEEAADWYAGELASLAGSGPGGGTLPRFDVLLLGMGPEGHVASIFPDSPAAQDDRPVVAVHDCPKPPPTRISLGFSAINAAEEVWLIAAGEAKAEAVARGVRGAPATELPAGAVHGRRATRWLLDAAAASALPPA
jgi:6-phosphogluconolactonase